jgi:outer membrane protein TolC
MLADPPAMPRRTAPFILGIVMAVATVAPAQMAIPTARNSAALVIQPDGNPDAKEKLPKLSVGDCINIAQERQPKLVALRASLGSAQASEQGLESARRIGQFSPDFKYRRQQAADGVLAATAELEQATHDVTYSVVWTYYSVVYAREQLKVAKDAVEFVAYYRDQVNEIVKSKKADREINQLTLNRLENRLAGGRLLLIEAQAGYDKARAALREAMGVDSCYLFDVADEALPDFAKFEIKKSDVLAHALTRRGEIIMASIATEVSRLEAYSQWSVKLRFRTNTFAAGGDIHVRPIPPGHRDGEYRPDAIGPEMPPFMFGNKSARTQKAWELAARSDAVLEKTRNLVTLEAENAFADYFYAGQSMVEAKKQADSAKANQSALKEVVGDKVSKAADLQALLEAVGDAAQGQAAFNKAVHQRMGALANLERITGGGIKINYPGR